MLCCFTGKSVVSDTGVELQPGKRCIKKAGSFWNVTKPSSTFAGDSQNLSLSPSLLEVEKSGLNMKFFTYMGQGSCREKSNLIRFCL